MKDSILWKRRAEGPNSLAQKEGFMGRLKTRRTILKKKGGGKRILV